VKTGWDSAQFIATGAQQQCFGPDPNRVAVIFSGEVAGGADVTFSFGRGFATLRSGIIISAGLQPLIITKEQIGTVMEEAILALGSAANGAFSIVCITKLP